MGLVSRTTSRPAPFFQHWIFETSGSVIYRVLPFAVYLAFLAFDQAMTWATTNIHSLESLTGQLDLWLYPVKTAVVMGLLIGFWPKYKELKDNARADHKGLYLAVAVGLAVYVAWVRMDWPWAVQGRGEASGYDPFRAGARWGVAFAVIRLFGASVVVPIMEELFWRSFLLRYLISPQFETVRLGALTPFSFLATTILFGLEHDLWFAGMTAGMAYTLLLNRTGDLWSCIVAHAVTNFTLGVHVLITGEWKWW